MPSPCAGGQAEGRPPLGGTGRWLSRLPLDGGCVRLLSSPAARACHALVDPDPRLSPYCALSCCHFSLHLSLSPERSPSVSLRLPCAPEAQTARCASHVSKPWLGLPALWL